MIGKRISPRLFGFDYSREGAYFVTVCVQDRQCLFGEIIDGTMRLNQAGQVIGTWWRELERKFPATKIDEYFVVMPNHFHGIVCRKKNPVPDQIKSIALRIPCCL